MSNIEKYKSLSFNELFYGIKFSNNGYIHVNILQLDFKIIKVNKIKEFDFYQVDLLHCQENTTVRYFLDTVNKIIKYVQ